MEILLVAGDPSADVHGANLIQAIKKLRPDIKISCLGGQHMAKYADRFVYDLVSLSVFGLSDSIKSYFRFKHIFKNTVLPYLSEFKPDAVVPIDFYGFNIHLARAAKLRRIPVVYYIGPQVWASRPERVNKIAKFVSKMLVILPFENQIYEKVKVKTVFVGHPLLDLVDSVVPEKKDETKELLIGLFPGSRRGVFAKHLSLFVEVGEKIQTKFSKVKFVLFRPVWIEEKFVNNWLKESKIPVTVVQEEDYSYRKKISMALSCSGTNTLENALLGIPTIIVYKTTWLFYLVALFFIKVPFIGIANIIAGKKLMPEFIQHQADAKNIADLAIDWINDSEYRLGLSRALYGLREKLGQPGVALRAAQEIINTAEEKQLYV